MHSVFFFSIGKVLFRSIRQGHSVDFSVFLSGAHIPLNQPLYLAAHGFLVGSAEMEQHFIDRIPDFFDKSGRVLLRGQRGGAFNGVDGGGTVLFGVHRLFFRWR